MSLTDTHKDLDFMKTKKKVFYSYCWCETCMRIVKAIENVKTVALSLSFRYQINQDWCNEDMRYNPSRCSNTRHEELHVKNLSDTGSENHRRAPLDNAFCSSARTLERIKNSENIQKYLVRYFVAKLVTTYSPNVFLGEKMVTYWYRNHI